MIVVKTVNNAVSDYKKKYEIKRIAAELPVFFSFYVSQIDSCKRYDKQRQNNNSVQIFAVENVIYKNIKDTV